MGFSSQLISGGDQAGGWERVSPAWEEGWICCCYPILPWRLFEIQLQAVAHRQCQAGWINADRLVNAVDILVCTFIRRNPAWMMEPKGFPSMSESNSVPLCFIACDSESKEGRAVPILSPGHSSKGEARLWCFPRVDSCSLTAYNPVCCVASR